MCVNLYFFQVGGIFIMYVNLMQLPIHVDKFFCKHDIQCMSYGFYGDVDSYDGYKY